VFQRIAVIAPESKASPIAAIHNPGRTGAAMYAGLTADRRPALAPRWPCGTSGSRRSLAASCRGLRDGSQLNELLETMPLTEVTGRVLSAGECAEQGWLFMDSRFPRDVRVLHRDDRVRDRAGTAGLTACVSRDRL
jgi:hypothetical protein